jgi:hypothetical protein
MEQDTPPRPSSRGRRIAVVALLVLGGLLSVLTVAAVWTRNLLLDTDRYVETVAPLASDPDLQETATRRIVEALMAAVDVEAIAADVLPGEAAAFAPVIASGTRSVVEDGTRSFLASDVFRDLWEEANRVAHRQVVTALTGDGGAVQIREGVVVIDLATIADEIRLRLVDDGLTLLDNVPISQIRAQLEVLEAEELEAVQDGVDFLQLLAWWLPVGVAVSFGAAVYLSRDRRATLRNVGMTLAASMAVLALGIGIGRRVYLDTVDGVLDPAAARATFDILTDYLRQGTRFVFAVGAVLAIGAWLTGPGVAAARFRALATRMTDRTGQHVRADDAPVGPVVAWVSAHHRGLRTGLVAVLGLIVITLEHPSAGALLTAIVVGAIGWGVIAVIASAGRTDRSLPTVLAVGDSATET